MDSQTLHPTPCCFYTLPIKSVLFEAYTHNPLLQVSVTGVLLEVCLCWLMVSSCVLLAVGHGLLLDTHDNVQHR